jgi:FMN phosphatase YigB (HAD superfamily)
MIRAVICDVYGTLLEVGPPPPDAEARWTRLWQESVAAPDPPSLTELDTAVRRLVPVHHAAGRARGLVQPEIDWPALAAQAFPALGRLPPDQHASFFYTHAQLIRSTRLARGAADCLRSLKRAGLVLGIASNAQACTRLELATSLQSAGLNPAVFDEDACFFSYEHGVAKPDPRVFHSLADRLARRGISAAETLMVGDRADTDVAPATAAGWAAWQLAPNQRPHAGDWPALQAWLGLA